jgi:hypothetical protein
MAAIAARPAAAGTLAVVIFVSTLFCLAIVRVGARFDAAVDAEADDVGIAHRIAADHSRPGVWPEVDVDDSFGVPSGLGDLLARATVTLDAALAAMFVIDGHDGESLVTVAGVGLPASQIGRRVGLGQGEVGMVASTGIPSVSCDVAMADWFDAPSTLVFPITTESGVSGALLFARDSGASGFGSKDVLALRAYADRAARLLNQSSAATRFGRRIAGEAVR